MKIKRKAQFVLSVLAAASILTAQLAVGATASDAYSEYKADISSAASAGNALELKASDYTAYSAGVAETSDDGSISIGADKAVDYVFSVPTDSVYNIYLSYAPVSDNRSAVDFGIKLDGDYPFDAAAKLNFPTAWNNETQEFDVDENGNQLTPKQVVSTEFFTYPAQDETGVEIKPYEFFLSAGAHKLTLIAVDNGVKLSAIKLVPPESDVPYEDYIKQYDKSADNDAEPLVLEAEAAINKTSTALIPYSDTLNANVSPSDSKRTMLNYIGGSSWGATGEQMSWKFNVKKDGLYKLAFNYKQSDSINRSSYRHLTVDGKTPFAEAREMEFEYSSKWKYYEFGDGDEPYLIWLTEGEHTFTLEVTLGAKYADYYDRLNVIVEDLNDIYLSIIKITGSSPDVNRDYELFTQIPDLEESLTENYEKLDKLTNDIISDSGDDVNELAASFQNMLRIIKKMLNSPYRAHDYVSSFYSSFSSISTWLQDMKNMPLRLDYVGIMPEDASADNSVSLFQGLKFRFSRFITSFTTDYDVEYDSNDKNTITVWTTKGRDQANALEVLIKQDFTPETGIKVNLKVVSASLINGLLSNSYPDVMLGMSRTDPVNYGIRNALYDLRQFDDYEEVIKRYQEGADVPYTYGGAAYALPVDQTFYIMFYRTDIMQKLGIEVPQTWSEFIKASVQIQRNNMEVYIPFTTIQQAGTVNAGVGSIGMYPTLMLQRKLPLYNDEGTATALNTPAAIRVFDEWIEMYTDYKIQKTADFYNRFRMGIMPLGIAAYSTLYNFVQMAPEIQGKYALALVPADDETGSRAVAGGGSGTVIINKSTKHDVAWEFLKWYTSAETQTEYSRRVESILGLVGRLQTANVEALNNMEWESDQLKVINEQWKLVEEIPEIPGSYYLTRSIDQAYWSVINGVENSKDAIARWSASADAEIERKYLEYGVK